MAGVLLRFGVTVAALPLCGNFLEGIHILDMGKALLLGAILGLIYMVLRPLTRLVLSVFNFCTLGLLNVVVDAWLVWTAAGLIENSVALDSFWWAFAIAFVINAARFLIDLPAGRRK
ncbi:MAG: phage holin family protein [Clostridia bacterium]|nr:phage holin family protein [Clostridia bacterium]